MVYDGTFTEQKEGAGVATSMFEQNHIPAFNQQQLDDLQIYLESETYLD